MQLKQDSSIRQALAAATCAALTGGAHAATPASGDWNVSSSLLLYNEQDRVKVIAPAVFVTKQLAEEESVTVKAVYDSLTGASPTGATPTDHAQNVAGATTAAGEIPMADFNDTRVSVGVDWSKRTGEITTRDLGVSFSSETDYTSFGGSIAEKFDLNQKLTTLAVGAGLTMDVVQPKNGAPTELQSVNAVTAAAPATSSINTFTRASGGTSVGGDGEGIDGETKNTVDVMLGVTQVLTRQTLAQLNWTHAHTSGYMNDPYKVVSVIHPTTGTTIDYLYEKRPDSRDSDALYGKLVHHFGEDVAHVSYRRFQDDWGINSDTVELHYHMKFGESFYVEPQLRWYQQTAADFYRHSLLAGETVDYASADLRLGEMDSTTLGVRIGAHIGDAELSFRYATMKQTGNSSPNDAIGVQQDYNLYPTLKASIITVNYSTPL